MRIFGFKTVKSIYKMTSQRYELFTEHGESRFE